MTPVSAGRSCLLAFAVVVVLAALAPLVFSVFFLPLTFAVFASRRPAPAWVWYDPGGCGPRALFKGSPARTLLTEQGTHRGSPVHEVGRVAP